MLESDWQSALTLAIGVEDKVVVRGVVARGDSTGSGDNEIAKFIVQIIVSIASAILTALGATSCMGY